MENVNARRGFLKGFGLLSAVVAGASAPYLANTGASTVVRNTADPVLSPPVDVSHLAPLGTTTLMLTADNMPPPPPPPVTSLNGAYIVAGGNYNTMSPMLSVGSTSPIGNKNNVKMSVGKDDRLWIEVDGKWRRVALEA